MLRLVVDSSATFTRDEAKRLGVTVVPMTYTLDGRPVAETFMGENPDVASLLEEGRISATEGVRPAAFFEVFSDALRAGDDVVCVTISSKLSSTYRHALEAARNALDAARDRARIEVIDSLSGISGMEMLLEGARARWESGCGFDEVVEGTLRDREQQGICFTVPNTDALRDSGRLALVPQSVGTLLNRLPVLILENGNIRHVATARGTAAASAKMAACVPTDGERELVITCYGASGPLSIALARAVREAHPRSRLRIKQGGPVLSYILGSGAVSVTWGPVHEA